MSDSFTTVLTTRELAARWSVHPNTVKRIANRGELPFFKVVSRGDRRYRLTDIREYEQRKWVLNGNPE